MTYNKPILDVIMKILNEVDYDLYKEVKYDLDEEGESELVTSLSYILSDFAILAEEEGLE